MFNDITTLGYDKYIKIIVQDSFELVAKIMEHGNHGEQCLIVQTSMPTLLLSLEYELLVHGESM